MACRLLNASTVMNVLSKSMLLVVILFSFPFSARATQSESREETRFRLDQIVNEQDLMIRNQRADRADVLHQQRDLEALKVYERIPLKEDLAGLEQDLLKSARANGLILGRVRVVGHSSEPEALPQEVFTDRPFHLLPGQIAQTTFLEVELKGKRQNLDRWMGSVHEQQMRLVEVQHGLHKQRVKSHHGFWQVRLQTFQFREILFTRLRPRNPYEVLSLSSEKDPALERLAQKAQDLIPRAAPFYENRRAFLLNQERLSFFFRKVGEKR